jgi:hypothetical protein
MLIIYVVFQIQNVLYPIIIFVVKIQMLKIIFKLVEMIEELLLVA